MKSDKSSAAAGIIKTKIKRSKRSTPPSHYILKIKSFSRLSDISKENRDGKFESDEFEAGEYKWKLVLYPNGNREKNGEGHISMYLASTDKNAVSSGCRVNVLVSFFIYDHIRDKYLTIQDGKIKRYHVLRTEHGFDQLLSLPKFNDPSNGYVVDDCCVFGAEVHVIKNTVKGNELSFMKNPPTGTFTWKIDKFSTLENEEYYSEVFSACGCKWKLKLYPKGQLEDENHSLSMFLYLDTNPHDDESQVYVTFNLLVKDQLNRNHQEGEASRWFKNSKGIGFGSFMPLEDLRNPSEGFLVNGTLVIEAQVTLISVSQNFIS